MTPKRSISPEILEAVVLQEEDQKYAAFNELLNQALKSYRLHLWALPIATRRHPR